MQVDDDRFGDEADAVVDADFEAPLDDFQFYVVGSVGSMGEAVRVDALLEMRLEVVQCGGGGDLCGRGKVKIHRKYREVTKDVMTVKRAKKKEMR